MPKSIVRPVGVLPVLAACCCASAVLAQSGADGDTHWDTRFGLALIEPVAGTQETKATAIAVDSQFVWIGGTFLKAAGLRANNIVRVRKATGQVEVLGTRAANGVNGRVNVIKPVAGGVYVGGYFTHAGVDSLGAGTETGPLAFFDGKDWKAAGPALTLPAGKSEVHAIAVGANGVFVGGHFSKGGDTALSHIGWLQGTAWSPLWEQGRVTQGLDGYPRRIIATPTALYVGGGFTVAGGAGVNSVARWNWTTERWDGLKGGMSHASDFQNINDMEMDAVGRLWVGQRGLLYFDTKADTGWTLVEGTENAIVRVIELNTPWGVFAAGSGGTLFEAKNRAFMTDKGWTPFDERALGLTVDIEDEAASDGQRLWFTGGGIEAVPGLAWYDGKAIGCLGNGIRNTRQGGLGITSFAEFDGKLIAAGSFSHLGNTAAEGIARWTGDAWEAVASPYESVHRVVVFKGALYAAGSLQKSGEPVAGGLARYSGKAWEIVPGFEKVAIGAVAAGSKYLWMSAAEFSAGAAKGPLARWDGTTLEPMGSQLTRSDNSGAGIIAIVPRGEEGACVAGRFDGVAGAPAGGVACTNGKDWVAIGGKAGGELTALAAIGNDLFAACDGTFPGGPKYLARWDGTAWAAVGDALDAYPSALLANGGDLYATGVFRKAGGLAVNGVARWDGKAWAALGSGVEPAAAGVGFVGPGGLWLGGGFSVAGGVPSRLVARYGNAEKKADLPMGIAGRAPGKKAKAIPRMRVSGGKVLLGSPADPARADGRVWERAAP